MSTLTKAIHELDRLAKLQGIKNVFQPGMARELLIAEALGHTVHSPKHGHDAVTAEGEVCEYLTAYSGSQIQLDRMFKTPEEKRQKSLLRISRYDRIYAVFFKRDTLVIDSIFLLDPATVLSEAIRLLDGSKNDISHIAFSTTFILSVGQSVKFGDSV